MISTNVTGLLAGIAVKSAKMLKSYPPFNVKKVSDTKYEIELAVAGFGKQDIEIELADGQLSIKGTKLKEPYEFVYKGISSRAFTKLFMLNGAFNLEGADLSNGLLKVYLEAVSTKKQSVEVL